MTRNRRRRLPIISALLLALVARAVVPVGFMPAADGSAQMTLCPDGMLMPSDAGNNAAAGMPGSGLHTDHCPYGAAPFAAPIAEFPITPALAAAINLPDFAPSAWVPSNRTLRSHQPRAPPA